MSIRRNTALPTYKYDHDGERYMSSSRKLFIVFFVLLMLVFVFFMLKAGEEFKLFIMPIWISLFFAMIAYASAPRLIFISPRYLICGHNLIYFANVSGAELSTTKGLLHLYTDQKKTLVIDRKLFPTNARKSQKVLVNKQKKFDKVSGKILSKVVRARPDAVVIRHD